MTDTAVTRVCEVLADSIEMDAEAHPQRVMYVRLGSSKIKAEITNGLVRRLCITDSLLRTADGLGVGTTLGELLSDPNLRGGNGERGVFVFHSMHCGLSFGLDHSTPGVPSAWVVRNRRDLLRAPSTTPVDLVLIVGQSPGHC
jgi:hypothetical protein